MIGGLERDMYENDKGRLRKLALSKRDSISYTERKVFSEIIANKLLSMPEIEKAKIIMCYRSFRSEADTSKIVENLLRMAKTLCFPVCENAGIMHAFSPNDENSWIAGKMGIMEPDREKSRIIAPEEIDIVICPIVAFDCQKKRIGYGGGYYDRYLPNCSNALKVGIAFEAQHMENIAADPCDQNMDIIITEEKVY